MFPAHPDDQLSSRVALECQSSFGHEVAAVTVAHRCVATRDLRTALSGTI
jgi:hypothetical protein